MMKKQAILLIFCILAIYSQTYAQRSPQEDIQKVMKEQIQSWNAGSVEGFMRGYWQNDSLLFIGKRGPKYGWTTVLNQYKTSYPTKEAMGTLEFKDLSISMLGKDHALVLGSWHVVKADGTLAEGWFTLTFKKTKAGWRIIADHTS